MRTRALPLLTVQAAVMAAIASGAAAAPAAAGVPPDAVTLLDGASTYWRWLRSDRPAVVVAAPGAAERLTVRDRKLTAVEANTLSVPVPPGWRSVDFDDSSWPRTAGR